jgi:plastocyanin
MQGELMRIRYAIVAVILFATAACSTSNSSVDSSPIGPTPAPVSSSSSQTVTGVTTNIPVGASGLTTTAFGANPLVVSVGTTVVWQNTDTIAHTSTSNSNVWNSGTIAPGQSFRFTFTSAGTFPYHCTIHPNMVGTLTVQ